MLESSTSGSAVRWTIIRAGLTVGLLGAVRYLQQVIDDADKALIKDNFFQLKHYLTVCGMQLVWRHLCGGSIDHHLLDYPRNTLDALERACSASGLGALVYLSSDSPHRIWRQLLPGHLGQWVNCPQKGPVPSLNPP